MASNEVCGCLLLCSPCFPLFHFEIAAKTRGGAANFVGLVLLISRSLILCYWIALGVVALGGLRVLLCHMDLVILV